MDKILSDKINLLKALAILLVVSGHLEFSLIPMFPPYSFQLALFFFISGLLFKEKYLDDTISYIKRRVQTLVIPYFLYEIFYLGVTYMIFKLTGDWLGSAPTWKNLLIVPFLNGHQLALASPLWFVIQLFITMISFLFVMKGLRKITTNKILPSVLFLLAGFLAIPIYKAVAQTPINLLIFRTVFSMCFVYLGYYYMHYIRGKYDIFTPKWLGAVIILQSIFWMFNRDYNPDHGIGLSYVLVWGRFDEQLIIPVLTALTGIWISLFIIHVLYDYLKDVKFLKLMGDNTFHIMANHTFVMYLITAVFLNLNGIDIAGKFSHKVFWIYNPVQTTYLYFVITMLVTTYVGVLQKKIKILLESRKIRLKKTN